MLTQLNAEVWMGILNWLLKHRREMAIKFSEFGDRDFAEITQAWLHQWTRNATLGYLDVGRVFHLAMLERNEMPRNFTDFSTIYIRYFDSGVLRFLRRIRKLFANVNLSIFETKEFPLEQFITVLRHLLPLINGVEALLCGHNDYPETIAFFCNEFPTIFFKASIFGIYRLKQQGFQESISPWLFTRQANDNPKTLIISSRDSVVLHEILQQIRENFLNPLVLPIGYFIRILSVHLDTVETTTIQNTQGEQLVMRKMEDKHFLLIARCPSDVGEEWLMQKFQQLAAFKFCEQRRRIVIDNPVVGQIDVTEEASSCGIVTQTSSEEKKQMPQQLDKAMEKIAQLTEENAQLKKELENVKKEKEESTGSVVGTR